MHQLRHHNNITFASASAVATFGVVALGINLMGAWWRCGHIKSLATHALI